MFGIGMSELIFIIILGLIVLGPERLCRCLQTLSRTINSSRNAIQSVKDDVTNTLAMHDIESQLKLPVKELSFTEKVDCTVENTNQESHQ
ncbi:hypothetical protein [Zooshikella sp. RANM57]|uniref:hypothetical protein n=1 Tax=Zooshikella sp. RANM57 TaxID=3425863 RepID=UPI003D6EE933